MALWILLILFSSLPLFPASHSETRHRAGRRGGLQTRAGAAAPAPNGIPPSPGPRGACSWGDTSSCIRSYRRARAHARVDFRRKSLGAVAFYGRWADVRACRLHAYVEPSASHVHLMRGAQGRVCAQLLGHGRLHACQLPCMPWPWLRPHLAIGRRPPPATSRVPTRGRIPPPPPLDLLLSGPYC